MRSPQRGSVLAVALFASTGCATILGGGTKQGVSIASSPSGASFVVKSSSGIEMSSGRTPQDLQLPRKNEYQIEFTMPGYQKRTLALTQGLNGWVWGNFIIGWIPGLIIDFVDGAARKLEPAIVNVTIEKGAGDGAMYGVVREYDGRGHLISDRRVELVRIEQ